MTDYTGWIIEQLKELAIALGEDFISEKRLEIYAEELLEEDQAEMTQAFVELRRRCLRFPQIAEVLDAIEIEHEVARWQEPETGDWIAKALSHSREEYRDLLWNNRARSRQEGQR